MSTVEEIPPMDALEMLMVDHRAVERLFAELKAHPVGQGREWVVSELISELATHAFIEEQVVYPLVRTAVPGGQELADAALEEHRALKDTHTRLGDLDPNDHEAEILLAHLQRDLRDHVDEEEGVLFRMLRAGVGEPRLSELAHDLERARKAAPRPSYADSPEWG